MPLNCKRTRRKKKPLRRRGMNSWGCEEGDPVLSEDEASAYLKMSRRSLQRIRALGGVRYICYLRKVFYRRSFLDEYILSAEKPASRVRRRKKRKTDQRP
jgi:hypothetical protein